ncbi:MAG: cation transporter [Ignavibacteria bacterium]|nr:cation transporter [Ignavibacteria bacterium]
MKSSQSLLVILVLTPILFLSNNLISNVKDIQHNKKITIKLNTIQCDMCIEKIAEAIKSVEGVVKTKVNLNKKTATITFNADLTNKSEIEKTITSAGYDANNKTADSESYKKLSSCCKRP